MLLQEQETPEGTRVRQPADRISSVETVRNGVHLEQIGWDMKHFQSMAEQALDVQMRCRPTAGRPPLP